MQAGEGRKTDEFVEHALIEGPFWLATEVILLVVPLEAVPVRLDLLRAILAHLGDPASKSVQYRRHYEDVCIVGQ